LDAKEPFGGSRLMESGSRETRVMKTVLSLEGIQFRGMREEVSQVLRKAILGGYYEPGQQIYEAELAKTFKLSRGPVRESLLQLEKESLVRNVFNKGWFVIQLSPDEITEITSLRVVLEVLALKLAKGRIKSRQLKRLYKIQDSMLADFRSGNFTEAIQADFEFHEGIWAISGHRILYETAVQTTTPYFAFLKMSKIQEGFQVERFYEGLENHHFILEFLEGKSDRTAEWCIRNHFAPLLYSDWRFLLDLFREEGPAAE
jgi:DNA-binding GntR family transcriptional regulator